jgi:hypothetical protein
MIIALRRRRRLRLRSMRRRKFPSCHRELCRRCFPDRSRNPVFQSPVPSPYCHRAKTRSRQHYQRSFPAHGSAGIGSFSDRDAGARWSVCTWWNSDARGDEWDRGDRPQYIGMEADGLGPSRESLPQIESPTWTKKSPHDEPMASATTLDSLRFTPHIRKRRPSWSRPEDRACSPTESRW